MIGAHDSLTYYKPVCKLYKLANKWWKCQDKSIEELYKYGVRFFDFRVTRHKGKWWGCHGAARLKWSCKTLEDICLFMADQCPEALYRIVLEDDDNKELFIKEAEYLCDNYLMLWRVDIKSEGHYMGSVSNNNQRLYDLGYKFVKSAPWVPPSHELITVINAKNAVKVNIKKQAEKTNSGLPFYKNEEALEKECLDKSELYILDYADLVF